MSDTATATTRDSGLTAAQLKALRPHVVSLKDGRLAAASTAAPKTVAAFTTAGSDIDAIFSTHLPAFIAKQDALPVPLVLWAHGGLVDKDAGFAIAQRQVDWWLRNGVYPIHFVWESGLWSSIGGALQHSLGGRDIDDFFDGILEATARLFGGERVWGEMKLDAAAASDPTGAGTRFVTALAAFIAANPDQVSVHAVGHSAGSIFHSYLIPAALKAGVPRFSTVSLLAPAVRVDTFKAQLLPPVKQHRIGTLAMFTMTDAAERDDTCLGVYKKSLLYLVSRAFEPQAKTPILGMNAFVQDDAALSTLFGSGGQADLVLSPTPANAPDTARSTAISHGAFDGDAPTMESVLRRITGLDRVVPFPAGTREVEPEVQLPEPPRSRDLGGARRALCIGIDAYPTPGDALHGAVADSQQWAKELTALGFGVTSLTDGDATRDGILAALLELVSTARSGDVLVVQYAGHGTQVPDENGDEEDGLDQAICPVDFRDGALIIDDDLGHIWDVIPDGVRLTMFADSCHSGSVNRDPGAKPAGETLARFRPLEKADLAAYRAARGLGSADEADAAARVASVQRNRRQKLGGREGLISACRSTEVAWETDGHGRFTVTAVPLLADAVRQGVSARAFVDQVVAAMGPNPIQTPEWHGTSMVAHRALLSGGATASGTGSAAAKSQAQAKAPVGRVEAAVAAAESLDGRSAAIAAFLRATADLLES